jgi:uncharacterized protein YraI
MKKIILFVLFFLLCAFPSDAQWVNSSGNKTADALVVSGSGNLYGIMVATDATNACTFAIYDGLSATSTPLLMPAFVVTTSATDRVQYFYFSKPVHFNTGVYVDITLGAGAVGYVIYYTAP